MAFRTSSSRPHPSPRFRPRLAALLALTVFIVPVFGAAQEPDDEAETGVTTILSPHAAERPAYIFPASGPPGTEVTLRVSLLPALTPVQVALGGTRSGFEALTFALTDEKGQLVETVRIPEWAERDRTHRFILFNAYFTAVYAATGYFHVTDSEGYLLREGEVLSVGPGCPTLTGLDNEVYSLAGDVQPLSVGSRIRVEGTIDRSGVCPEGLVIRVAATEPHGDP